MKVTILRENLYHALSLVNRSSSTRGELPILENVLIKAEQGVITFSTTSLETGIATNVGGKIEEEGAITVSVRLLSEYVNTLRTDKIELTVKEGTLWVTGSKSKASFTTIPALEFPTFPQKEQKAFAMPVKDFRLITSYVTFAASSDEGRPVLTGILCKPTDDHLLVAATDGFRLSVCEFSSTYGFEKECVIPSRSLVEIGKIIEESKVDTIETAYAKGGNQLIFSLPDTSFFSRLIDGEFPEFKKIIPTSSTTNVTIEKEAFLQAIKAAAIFARESANIVRLTIKKNALVISANTPQIGEESSEIEVVVEGEENEIAFNFRFLIDFLNSVSEEEIVLQMTSPLSPALFRPVKNSAYSHIIMPVRVQG